MNIKYSVIMPCYNVASFIDNTLNRFNIAVAGRRDIELILINDGSTDGSLDILSKKEYSFLQLISTNNHGVSHARNQGLTQCKGDYVMFLDADDYYESNIFVVLDEKLGNADVLLSGYRRETISGQTIRTYHTPEMTDEPTTTILDLFFAKKIPIHICSMVVKSSIISINNLKFSEDVSHCEDIEFIIKTLTLSSLANVVQAELFCYVDQPGSAVNKVVGISQLTKIDVFKNKIPDFFCAQQKDLPEYYYFYTLTVFLLLMRSALKLQVENDFCLKAIHDGFSWLQTKKTKYPNGLISLKVFFLSSLFSIISFRSIYSIMGKLRKK